jgi:hypothetical protein
MILQMDKYEPFVPKWMNNEQEDKPIKIYYKNPTMPLYERLIPKPELVVKIDPDGNSEGAESTMKVDNKNIVLAMVTKIENLEIPTENGNNILITDPKDLFGANVPSKISGLIDEIGGYLQGILAKKGNVEAKN